MFFSQPRFTVENERGYGEGDKWGIKDTEEGVTDYVLEYYSHERAREVCDILNVVDSMIKDTNIQFGQKVAALFKKEEM